MHALDAGDGGRGRPGEPQPPGRVAGRIEQAERDEPADQFRVHAGAASQAVSIVVPDHALILILSIRDSGPGIGDTNSLLGEKLGLKSMKYRVEAVGGAFELKSRQGMGTEIRCKIPFYQPGV